MDNQSGLRPVAGGTPALPGKQISFCNTGHWASLGWFVGSELMGNADVALYDGPMVEWSADESLPMERRISIE